MTKARDLPVAVIGAGPIGLAAAAHLAERGIPFTVFEVGEKAGSSIAEWGHVRLFSPWEFVTDAAATRLLDRAGWHSPNARTLPTGRELIDSYLTPLAATPEIAAHLRFGVEVVAVTRTDASRTSSLGREQQQFLLRLRDGAGHISEAQASAVIDASGTWRTPNPLGANGLEPLGAETALDHIVGALPDVLGRDRTRFSGRHTVVVGSGHSAANTLLALAELADDEPGTSATWVLRRAASPRVYGFTNDGGFTSEAEFTSEAGPANDELPARARLGVGLHDLVSSGRIALVDRFHLSRLERVDGLDSTDSRIRLHGTRRGDPVSLDADLVVNSTGFRPDLAPFREIRLELDEIVESPRRLAPLIDPNLHSCGTVPAHGEAELAHPEKNYYIVGMKSYGRAPTFLLATGYEQVRSVVASLAGDHAAAREVRLVLPATGVCSADDGVDGSCCETPPARVELTLGGRLLA